MLLGSCAGRLTPFHEGDVVVLKDAEMVFTNHERINISPLSVERRRNGTGGSWPPPAFLGFSK